MSKLSKLVLRALGRNGAAKTSHPQHQGTLNKVLLAAYQLRKLRPLSSSIDLLIVTDQPADYSLSECGRILSPWSDWLNVRHLEVSVDSNDSALVEGCGLESNHVVMLIVNEPTTREAWKTSCDRLGIRHVVPQYPSVGTLDYEFIREVSHFDFEIGGKNEWHGIPTNFARETLRQISCTNCREYYPAFATRPLLSGPDARPRPLRVLDIGCGPISILRWGAIQGELSITGVDPLLDMYALVLARHGLESLPKIRCDREVVGFGEELDRLLPNEQFDMVYTQNSLDHTQQPQRVIEQIGRRLAPHGLAVIQVATREGTRRKWDQLHKTDIYINNNELVFAHQHTPARPLLSPASGLRLKHVECYTPDWLACVLERN